ncbi:hypothetical protein FCE95_02935 [Luteimonas gilva]|uniref:Uncharacterized protein n=1 Tax=Luteimonas gilva TaxID=2572684 RepID=A0A4U5K2S9_9GAMM|nr:hypothetical protein [Luteimonas gilva]TKR33279.1 hypothetical protein FCE95_02935 [Luteimonas gilva]
MPVSRIFPLAAAAACAWLSADPAMAVDPQTVAPETAPSANAQPVPGLGRRMDPSALDALRGGDDDWTQNNIDIQGQLDGNTAQNIASGDNVLDGGAFANASGIATVIQNSGSNVLIQNGMVVDVRFAGSNP